MKKKFALDRRLKEISSMLPFSLVLPDAFRSLLMHSHTTRYIKVRQSKPRQRNSNTCKIYFIFLLNIAISRTSAAKIWVAVSSLVANMHFPLCGWSSQGLPFSILWLGLIRTKCGTKTGGLIQRHSIWKEICIRMITVLWKMKELIFDLA